MNGARGIGRAGLILGEGGAPAGDEKDGRGKPEKKLPLVHWCLR